MDWVLLSGVVALVGIWIYLWRSGLWRWIVGTPKQDPDRLSDEKQEQYTQILQQQQKAHRTAPENTDIDTEHRRDRRSSPRNHSAMNATLTKHQSLLPELVRYDTVTKRDYPAAVTEAWLHAATYFEILEPTDTPGLYIVKHATLTQRFHVEPANHADTSLLLDVDQSILETLYTHGIRSLGFIAFTSAGPQLTYSIGREPQTDLLADPSLAAKVATILSESQEEIPGIIDIGALHIIAGKTIHHDKTHIIYGGIAKQANKEEVTAVVSSILDHFNGVPSKHSFKLAVYQGLDKTPANTLRDKAKSEKHQYETKEEK